MGQPIAVSTPTVDGDLAGFHLDRGITGQDGIGFDRTTATDADSFPGHLAVKLFEGDDAIDHVFVASNQVVARRPGGWDGASLDAAVGVIANFFVFYPAA